MRLLEPVPQNPLLFTSITQGRAKNYGSRCRSLCRGQFNSAINKIFRWEKQKQIYPNSPHAPYHRPQADSQNGTSKWVSRRVARIRRYRKVFAQKRSFSRLWDGVEYFRSQWREENPPAGNREPERKNQNSKEFMFACVLFAFLLSAPFGQKKREAVAALALGQT